MYSKFNYLKMCTIKIQIECLEIYIKKIFRLET